MKIKVLKQFSDKDKHELKYEGKVYDYPEERAKELIEAGYAEIVKATEKKEEK